MRAPGILHRVSFLVVLNSLFIFAAVTYVSHENGEAMIDRLIGHKYDFMMQYFRTEIAEHDAATVRFGCEMLSPSSALDTLFERAEHQIRGLAGLSLLSRSEGGQEYSLVAQIFRADSGFDLESLAGSIAQSVSYTILSEKPIFVGPRVPFDGGRLKTMYFPLNPQNHDSILAASYIVEEVFGSDARYMSTLTLLFFVMTLITLLIINLLFRNFIRPIQQLIMGMERTAEGKVLHTIEHVRNDEIGRVTTAFNTMSTALWNQRQQLLESNRSLMELNVRMTETLNQLSETSRSLSESEAFLSKLIENTPHAVIATDAGGNILIFSRAAMTIFDVRPDEALKGDLRRFFPFAPDKVFPSRGDTGRIDEEEMICAKTDGETFPSLVCRVPIKNSSGVIDAYLFIIRDISESHSFQEMMIAIDRMATRGVMAGEIAHEINNYLAIILGNVELLPLLLAKGDMAKVEKKLEVLRGTVTKIQRFSEGLMGYGNEEAVIEPGDLNQLIENLIAFLKPQNRYDHVRFHLSLSAQIPLVAFDSTQLQQLLVNLFNNAADALHGKEGDKQIEVITEMEPNSEKVRILIRDNAGGLPDDLKEVIFQQRYMGKRHGRGFGLVIAKRIIDKHNGEISYLSEPGVGATFIIALAVQQRQATNLTSGSFTDKVTA